MTQFVHESRLKSYRSYLNSQQYGINCRINYPFGDYPLHRHDYIEIEYITKGKVEHELNGYKTILSSGYCYGLGYRDLHRFTVIEPVEFRNICIFYKECPPMIQKLLNSVQFPFTAQIPLEELTLLNQWFDALSHHINHNFAFNFEKITAYATLVLTSILEHSAPVSEKSLEPGYKYIIEAMSYIGENFTHTLTLQDVSSHVNLSPNYFSNLFAKICGCTFINYLTQQRIEDAKNLLSHTNQSITEITFSCGFGSFSTFSRAFKQACGCSPHEFRNKTKEPTH